MICFITDTKNGECDVLEGLKTEVLIIRSLEGELCIEIKPPGLGWSHEQLVEAGAKLNNVVKGGADAFLGSAWVGSTEV